MIKQIRIEQHSQEWHDFRYERGFGGSDIASVLATRSSTIAELTYTPPIKQFLSMIGEPVQQFTGNVASEGGHFFEGVILKWLKYYDLDEPDQLQMFRRMAESPEKRLNKVIQPKVFMTNSKYPHLFYSPDSFVWPKYGTVKMLGECKTTTSMEANRYTNHLNPSFFCQVQQGLMITELPFAILCILIDGRWLECITVEPHLPTWELILEASEEMWARITKARQIKKEYGLPAYFGVNPSVLTDRQREGAQLLADLEPDITGTDTELDFIREMIVPSEADNPMPGTDAQRQWCVEYLELGEEQDILEIERKKRQIYLLESLQGSNKAEFLDGSYFSYKADKNGKRRFYISPKVKAQ